MGGVLGGAFARGGGGTKMRVGATPKHGNWSTSTRTTCVCIRKAFSTRSCKTRCYMNVFCCSLKILFFLVAYLCQAPSADTLGRYL